MKLNHLVIPHRRINSKWIKDLNVKPKTIKIIEEKISSKITDIARSNILWDISTQASETKENKQMELYQTEQFLHSKGKHQQNKNTIHRMGEHIRRYI